MRTKYSYLILLFTFMLVIFSCESKHEQAQRLNNEAIELRITNFITDPKNDMMDIWDYTPISYDPLDTLTNYYLDSIPAKYHLIHVYQGKNVAGRKVKRTASVFFNNGLEVISIKNILYHNPLVKDSLKHRIPDSPLKEETSSGND